MRSADAAALDDLIRAYRDGDRSVLFQAILMSKAARLPIPDWAERELRAALERYDTGKAASLGEAFGMPNRRDLRDARKRELTDRKVSRLMAVFLDVERLKGKPDRFARVAELHNLTPATVERWYYDATKPTKPRKPKAKS